MPVYIGALLTRSASSPLRQHPAPTGLLEVLPLDERCRPWHPPAPLQQGRLASNRQPVVDPDRWCPAGAIRVAVVAPDLPAVGCLQPTVCHAADCGALRSFSRLCSRSCSQRKYRFRWPLSYASGSKASGLHAESRSQAATASLGFKRLRRPGGRTARDGWLAALRRSGSHRCAAVHGRTPSRLNSPAGENVNGVAQGHGVVTQFHEDSRSIRLRNPVNGHQNPCCQGMHAHTDQEATNSDLPIVFRLSRAPPKAPAPTGQWSATGLQVAFALHIMRSNTGLEHIC